MAGINNTPFSPNADLTAQLTGSGQPISGTTAITATANTTITSYIAGSTPTRYLTITSNGANYNVICANSVVPAGGIVTLNLINAAEAARTVTFLGGFRTNTTVVGVSSKLQMCMFVSDGTTLNMVAQSPTGAE